MRVLVIGAMACVFSFGAEAQEKVKAKYQETITKQDLKEHLQIIASDSLEGRETGKRGQRMAADYIRNHFKEIGLLPAVNDTGYIQPFDIDLVEPAEVALAFEGQEYSFPDNLLYLGDVASQKIRFTEVVFCGYGIVDSMYNDYGKEGVAGKVVIMKSGEPTNEDGTFVLSGTTRPTEWSRNPIKKIEVARKMGAKAIIEINPELKSVLSRYKRYLMRTRVTLSEEGAALKAPYVMIGDSAASALLNITLADMPGMELGKTFKVNPTELSYTNRSEKGSSSNVLGYIKGEKRPNEYVVLTAHYDHLGIRDTVVFNGADDDGSGTVSVMELAEAFAMAKKNGEGPARSMIFMCVSGEEKGLLGSEYYTDHPTFPLENTVVNLNIDMVGRVDKEHEKNPDYVYVIGSEMLSSELKKINEKENKSSLKLDLDYRFDDPEDPNRFYYRSDHYNFAKNDIPVAFFFNGTHDDYHRSTDTEEKINYEKMVKIDQLVFRTAWELANRNKRIQVDMKK